MTVSMDKQYTSNGKPVRILCTDKPGDYPVVTIIDCSVATFTLEGRYRTNDSCIEDLKEVWTPKCGELCYFWNCSDEVKGDRGIIVRKFKSSIEPHCYFDMTNIAWKHCAPFDGTLPEGFVK
jgi:hypothetical protein